MQRTLQKLFKCTIKMMRKIFTSIVLLAISGAALASPAIPPDLNGCKIQFSYPESWKFTPLLIHFGESEAATPNTYAVQGEGRSCEVTYTPDAAAGKAQLSVSGSQDKACISMNFITATCGTAHMKWNGVDYHHLNFRLEGNAGNQDYLCRMGDPVGDVMPPSLAGKVLKLDFSGAFGGLFNPETQRVDYRGWDSARWVVKFARSGEVATAELSGEKVAVSATYEPMGCGAMISLNGEGIRGQITLDFAASDSGLARVEWEKGESDWVVCAARFFITAEENDVAQVDDSKLRELIARLEQTQYKSAVERLYRKRLLTLLPRILEGGDINNVLPNANGTTALHNACGLSHVQIVQWLVDHGADLNARTAKGASVDDCVGGPNAKAIRSILRNARRKAVPYAERRVPTPPAF